MLAHEFLLFQKKQMKAILGLQKEFSNMHGLRFSRSSPVWTLTKKQEKADAAAMSTLFENYRRDRSDAIQIKDDYILPILDSLEGVDTLLDGCIPYKGLYYYGFTVIPAENVPKFEKVIHDMSQGHEFANLLALCEKANALHCGILHCGI